MVCKKLRGEEGLVLLKEMAAHSAEKLDRSSAEFAARFWHPDPFFSTMWRKGVQDGGVWEQSGARVRHDFLCVFPVCLMCSSGPGHVSCVWWVPGPRSLTKRQLSMKTLTWQAEQLLHASGEFHYKHKQTPRVTQFTKWSSWGAETSLTPSYLHVSNKKTSSWRVQHFPPLLLTTSKPWQ